LKVNLGKNVNFADLNLMTAAILFEGAKAMPILSAVQQAAAQQMDSFAALGVLMREVTSLEDNLGNLVLVTPQLLEARSISVRDAMRAVAEAAEQVELAIWIDDTRAWALADSIRMRASLLWNEWKEAKGERCLWLAQERAGPIARQLRAIYRLGELLHIEMTQCQHLPSA